MKRTNESTIKRLFSEHLLKVVSLDIEGQGAKSESGIVVSHLSYPNVEAHLFTAANAAGWIPKLTSAGDIEVSHSSLNKRDEGKSAWDKLMNSIQVLMNRLKLGGRL